MGEILLARHQPAPYATIRQRSDAFVRGLAKGLAQQKKFPQESNAWEGDLLAEAEKYHLVLFVYTEVWHREGKT